MRIIEVLLIILNKKWGGIFLLKFSTEMLIRTMKGTLTHNGCKYIVVLMQYICCYVLVFKKFNKNKKNNYGTTNFNRIYRILFRQYISNTDKRLFF